MPERGLYSYIPFPHSAQDSQRPGHFVRALRTLPRAANIVSRHIFECTLTHAYMNSKLMDCYEAKTGNRRGEYSRPPPLETCGPRSTVPSTHLRLLRNSRQLPTRYASESQFRSMRNTSHKHTDGRKGRIPMDCEPNCPTPTRRVCSSTHADKSDGTIIVDYVVAPAGENSPLPFVNWCVIDLLLFTR